MQSGAQEKGVVKQSKANLVKQLIFTVVVELASVLDVRKMHIPQFNVTCLRNG